MDLLHEVLNLWLGVLRKGFAWLDYNRFLALGVVLAVLTSAWVVGCEPRTRGLTSEQRVTLLELEREVVSLQEHLDKRAAEIRQSEVAYNAEVQGVNRAIELAEADLRQQVELRLKLIEVAGGLGTAIATGGVTAPTAIATVTQLLTLLAAGGLALDNRRKNAVINRLKEPT